MRAWPLAVLLFACTKSRTPDCDIVKNDPGNAAAKLSQKYPGAPVKVAEMIERCVAPSGSPCERLAKIVAAIPGMMPGGGPQVTAPPNVLELCKGMPAEMQRCMLPSYVLAHPDECAKLRERMAATPIETIEIEPRGSPPRAAVDSACLLEIEVTADRVTLRLDKMTKEVARPGGKTDPTALRAQLDELATTKCGTSADLTSADDVAYEEVIAIMDVALQAGFTEIGLSGRDTSAIKSSDALPDRTPPARGRDALKEAPVIVVTRTAVLVDSVEVAKVDRDVSAPIATALAKKSNQGGLAILQADAASSMRTINQVIAGAKQRGFDNLLFAVKNRP